MEEIAEWWEAIRENVPSVLVAIGGVTAVFGLDFSVAEQTSTIEGLDAVVASGLAAYAAFNVLVARVLGAFKADPDIDTGPTTPGPTTEVEV